MIIHNMEQGSDEWHAIRKGRMTASHAQEIGNNGKGLDTYIFKIMAAYYSSGEVDNFTNRHMERGNELEDQARSIYELENDVVVDQVGFIELDEFSGCSPDGLIADDGGLEIKCHDDVGHFKLLTGKPIESKYLWQIQMSLLVTGRKWWDYMAYNPNFEQATIVRRIEPDKKFHDQLIAGLDIGKTKIKDLLEIFV